MHDQQTIDRNEWLSAVISDSALEEKRRILVAIYYPFLRPDGTVAADLDEVATQTHVDSGELGEARTAAASCGYFTEDRATLPIGWRWYVRVRDDVELSDVARQTARSIRGWIDPLDGGLLDWSDEDVEGMGELYEAGHLVRIGADWVVAGPSIRS